MNYKVPVSDQSIKQINWWDKHSTGRQTYINKKHKMTWNNAATYYSYSLYKHEENYQESNYYEGNI